MVTAATGTGRSQRALKRKGCEIRHCSPRKALKIMTTIPTSRVVVRVKGDDAGTVLGSVSAS